MHMKLASKVVILLFVAITTSMYQEAKAQKKRPAAAKPAITEIKPVAPEISYSVSMSKPWTHLLEVEMLVKWEQMPEKAELKMPVWTPGSYLIREYARHVQDFAVKNSAGAELAWRKTSKNTWQVDTKGAARVIAGELPGVGGRLVR